MSVYAISQLVDSDQIRNFLKSDQNFAAYAIGDLDPRYADGAVWFGAARTGEIEAIMLVYDVLDPPVLFLMGDQSAISALLNYQFGLERFIFIAPPGAESLLTSFYQVKHTFHMLRMRVTSGTFIPFKAGELPVPVALETKHAAQVLELQKLAAKADNRDWEDVAFVPEMVEGGYYFGVFEGDKLIATAGTHLVAPDESVAAVGNVVVHPDHRRRGLGTLVSHAVTKALIDAEFSLIVLNVSQTNAAAIKVYRKLGYRQVSEFIEGIAAQR